MFHRVLRMIALAAVALVPAAPSYSATYLITYEGVIRSGFDLTGVFGEAFTDLAGEEFQAVFSLTLPANNSYFFEGPDYSIVGGGSTFGLTSPLTAVLKINTTTRFLDGQGFFSGSERFLRSSFKGADEIYNVVNDFDLWGNTKQNFVRARVQNFDRSFLGSASLSAPLSYDLSLGDVSEGYFQISENDGHTTAFASGIFSFTSVRVTGAVPESDVWLMLIVGFGVLGTAMRVTTRRASAAAF